MAARRTRPSAKASLHVTQRRLGGGSSASVHLAHVCGQEVAAKLSGPSEDARRQCRREARRLSRLRHPHIVRIVGVSETGSTVLLATELMRAGSLFHALAARRGAPPPRATVLRLALQLSSALAHVHACGFSSGDVKSLNALLSAPLDECDRLPAAGTLKLCDFGLSRRLHAQADDDAAIDPALPWHTTVGADSAALAGTFSYLAPECFEHAPKDAAGLVGADVYALGVVLWEIATAEVPWAGFSIGALMRVVRDRRTLQWPAHTTADTRYIALVERCWCADVSARPSAAAVVKELQAMDAGGAAQCLLPSVSYSDVSESSLPGVHAVEDGLRSMTSEESAALTSIVSDDGDIAVDCGSFDVTISLFRSANTVCDPASPPATHAEQRDGDVSATAAHDDSDSSHADNGMSHAAHSDTDSDTDSSQDGAAAPHAHDDRSDDADFAVCGEVTGWAGPADAPAVASTAAAPPPARDEFASFEAVVEVDDKRSDAAPAGAAKRVRFAGAPVTAADRASSAPSPACHASQTAHNAAGSAGSAGNAPAMATQQGEAHGDAHDDAYGFLDATNELSEFDLTFRDSSSVESAHSLRRPRRYFAGWHSAALAGSVDSTADIVKSAAADAADAAKKTDTASPPPHSRFAVTRSSALAVISDSVDGAPCLDVEAALRAAPAAAAAFDEHPHAPKRAASAMHVRAHEQDEALVRSSSAPLRSAPVKRAGIARRDYSALPLGESCVREIEEFDDEDANAYVLYSVMRYSHLLQR